MRGRKLELLVLIVAIVLPTVVTWIYFVSLKDSPAAVQKGAYGIGKTIQFALPGIWIWLCCRESLVSLIPWRRVSFAEAKSGAKSDAKSEAKSEANLAGGMRDAKARYIALAFGAFVALSVFVGYYFIVTPLGLADPLVAQVNEKVAGMSLDSPLKFILLGVFYALVHSFMEEYYWRWFVFGRLLGHTTFWIALVVSSVGFMAHHVILMATFLGWNSPLAYLISATVAIGGAVWAWLYHRSAKLQWPWISHMIVDAAIFALGYVLVFKP